MDNTLYGSRSVERCRACDRPADCAWPVSKTISDGGPMKSIRRWSASLAVVAGIAMSSPSIQGQGSPASVQGLGDKIAGTYLGVEEDGAEVLQIDRDGNLRAVFSIQFTGGGVLGESFSNTMGSW